MSLSNEEWNEGRTRETLEAQILALLRQNRRPFNITDIVTSLYDTKVKDFGSFLGAVGAYWTVQNALEKLVREGTVQAKIIKQQIGAETYYKAV